MYCSVAGCDPGFPLSSLKLLDRIVMVGSAFWGWLNCHPFFSYLSAGDSPRFKITSKQGSSVFSKRGQAAMISAPSSVNLFSSSPILEGENKLSGNKSIAITLYLPLFFMTPPFHQEVWPGSPLVSQLAFR